MARVSNFLQIVHFFNTGTSSKNLQFFLYMKIVIILILILNVYFECNFDFLINMNLKKKNKQILKNDLAQVGF